MERRLISGHSPYEPVVGFSRAVVVGQTVHVAGTAPIPADGSSPPTTAPTSRPACASRSSAARSEQAGASFADVVRTRIYVVDRADYEAIARAHGEVFGEIRPASTAVVAALLDPAWKVEIEAEAVVS